MKRSVSPFVAVLALALTFSSCTCNNSTPSTPEAPPTQPRTGGFGGMLKPTERSVPEAAKGAVTPKPVEARQPPPLPTVSSEAKLPDDFPSDVPVFEGATVVGVQNLANNARNVVFMIEDAEAPEVFDFYKSDMTHSGWKVEQESQGDDLGFLSFKKDKMVANVSITRDPKSGKRVIAVMYYEEEPLPFPEF